MLILEITLSSMIGDDLRPLKPLGREAQGRMGKRGCTSDSDLQVVYGTHRAEAFGSMPETAIFHLDVADPPSYALAMLCRPGLAIAKAIASWDHRHDGFARALDIPTLMVARSRLLSQPP